MGAAMRHRICLRLCLAALAAVGLFAGVDKKLPVEQTSNEKVDISATAITDKEQIRQELGSDFNGELFLVRVTLRDVSDKPIQVSLDDFLLVSSKDGQRSEPYAPSQLAGNSGLVLTPQGTRNGIGAGPNRPRFGGMGGGIGMGGGGVGNTGTTTTGVEAKVENAKPDTPNPLLAVLKDKCLPEKEITESVSGLLYFPRVGDGKIKGKDLELHYKGPGGKLSLRFRP
jgi:hypothetical protein